MADLSPPEAVQNIASVYNKDNLTVTNLTVTDKINSGAMKLNNMTFRTMASNYITTDGALFYTDVNSDL